MNGPVVVEPKRTGRTRRSRRLLIGLGVGQLLLSLTALVVFDGGAGVLWAMASTATTGALLFLAVRRSEADDDHRLALLHEYERVAPLGSWSLDLASQVFGWSDGMCRLLGYDPADVPATSRAALRALHPVDRVRVIDAARATCQGGPPADLVVRARDAQGGERLVRLRMMVADGPDGHVARVSGVCHDLTDLLSPYSALVQAFEEVDGAARYKEAILSSLSHEIRTPLTSILGFAEVLSDEVDGAHREFVRSIQRNGIRLLDTLTAVMDLAYIEGRMMPAEVRELDLGEQVEELVAAYADQADEKGLTLRTAFRGTRLRAVADPKHLRSALRHLLENAIKFTPQGGVVVEVEASGGWAYVRVHDTGIGIDAAFLPHVFEAFRQESSGYDRSHEGSGLGLALSRHLAELMGGTLRVESEKGKGSTFTLALPCEVPSARGGLPELPGPEALSTMRLVSCLPRPVEPDPHVRGSPVAEPADVPTGLGFTHRRAVGS